MSKKNKTKKNNELQQFDNFVIFQTEHGKVNIDVYFQDETLWLTQKRIAELFEKGRSTITEHLIKIFADGELIENSVCRDSRHTAEDGKQYTTKYYNLKAITAIGSIENIFPGRTGIRIFMKCIQSGINDFLFIGS